FGVRPDHEVGVGPQARNVVQTADHDPLLLALLEEGRRLVDDVVPLLTQLPGADREHREHQVSDGRVQSVIVQASHKTYRAMGVSTARTAAAAARPAAPTQAGTPIPSR